MSLDSRITALAQAIGADIKKLFGPKVTTTAITAENYSIASMLTVSALAVEGTWAPKSSALSVVPTAFFSSIGDTSSANMVGAAHQISTFNLHITRGGGTQAAQYGQEFRVRQEGNSTLQTYVATKHVLEPTVSNSGTLGEYVIEQFDDMSAAVTHVGTISRQFLDPRILTVHRGAEVREPLLVNANLTLTNLHSGKTLFVFSATDVTLTIPNTVLTGLKFDFIQVSTGKVIISSPALSFIGPDPSRTSKGVGLGGTVVAAPSSGLIWLRLDKPATPKITVGKTAPASPALNDLWVDTN